MVSGVCFLQEGQIPGDVVTQLADGIRQIAETKHLGETVDLTWIVIPEGQGWTAGEPSTTSIVSLTAPPMDQDHREAVLHAICELWMARTGCTAGEILATVVPAA